MGGFFLSFWRRLANKTSCYWTRVFEVLVSENHCLVSDLTWTDMGRIQCAWDHVPMYLSDHTSPGAPVSRQMSTHYVCHVYQTLSYQALIRPSTTVICCYLDVLYRERKKAAMVLANLMKPDCFFNDKIGLPLYGEATSSQDEG